MLITNYEDDEDFNIHFKRLASKAAKIVIASGYLGASQLEGAKELFLDIVKKKGTVTIIHGMGMWEGIQEKLEKTIKEINTELTKFSSDSGIFFHSKKRFHGKVYFFETWDREEACIIGSSNFSSSGASTNIETNLLQRDLDICKQTKNFLDKIREHSLKFDEKLLPKRGVARNSLREFEEKPATLIIPEDIQSRKPDLVIPIRYTPQSGLNLTFGKGRLNSATGFYKARPYYEVELTIQKEYWKSTLPNFVPNQKDASFFKCVTDNGQYFQANFKRKFNDTDRHLPIYETGVDFMSSPREALGQYIKNKLIDLGSMNYGDRVTEEVLEDSNKKELKFKVVGDKTLYLEF